MNRSSHVHIPNIYTFEKKMKIEKKNNYVTNL